MHLRIGGGDTRDAPPLGSKFFHFHEVFGKNLQNNANLAVGAPSGKNPGSATVIYQKTMHQHWRIQDFRGQQPLGLGRKPII